MTEPVFRDATRADLAAVVELLADDFLGAERAEIFTEPLPESYVRSFEAIAADPRGRLIGAELAGRVVGCYQLTIIPGLSYKGAWKAIIEGVRVASNLRSTGIGAKMLAHAASLARDAGARALSFTRAFPPCAQA